MYTADALAQELKRLVARSSFHSVAIAGRDPLANAEYLCATFDKHVPTIPMMLDTDGQRPAELGLVAKHLGLVQVTLEGSGGAAAPSMLPPPPPNVPAARDRRWIMLLERAAALHGDVRFALRLPPPVGT